MFGKIIPRIYKCRDIYLVYWLDFEIKIPRIFRGGDW